MIKQLTNHSLSAHRPSSKSRPHGSGRPQDSVRLGEDRGQDVGAELRQAAQRAGNKGDAVYQVGSALYRDFPNRQGYDQNFLGAELPMPRPDDSVKDQAAPLLKDPSQTELKYTHFSVVMNKERRAPWITAVNIDGAQHTEHERDGKWVFDGRMDRKYQMGNEAYSNNAFDRGHMVRRRDPMWGPDAFAGQDDTFVYTNSALQHSQLNQHNWLDLENHILNNAIAMDRKVTVFTGPVLAADDPVFNNKGKMDTPTRIPQAFYKVVVWNEDGKGLRSEAYVMSQKDLLNKGQANGNHAPLTDLTPYRVPLSQLEKMTHIDFGPMADEVSRPELLKTA